MKIIFFNNCWPTKDYPAIGTYAKSIVEVLEATGADVKVCALYSYKKTNKIIDYILFYIRLLFLPLPKDSVLYINHYVFLIPLILRLLFIRRRCVFHWHGEELVSNSKPICFLRWLMIKTFRSDAVHISPSRFYATSVIMKRLKIPESKIIISPSGGVDINQFSSCIHSINDMDTVNIGFSAALSEHKGINYLIDLILNSVTLESKLGHKVHFHVIKYGSGSLCFERQLLEHGITNVSLYEPFKKEDLHTFYDNVHLLLFLSKRESLGLTVLESMSCGVPVLARNTSSMPELVHSGFTGELVDYNPTVSEIIDKIAFMVSYYSVYDPRSFVIKNYSKDSVLANYKILLHKMC